MWFRNIFLRRANAQTRETPLFDENFLRRLERLSIQAQRTLRGSPIVGSHPSHHLLPSSIFSDHRPYTTGDDLRYVDWNAYARHDHMLHKTGEVEQDVDVHLLLDVSRSMAWGNPPKLRAMQQLAGALGYLALAHSDRIYVVPFGTTALKPFGPSRGLGRLMDMLEFIGSVSVQQETELSAVLQQHARQYRRGGLLVLCSDLLAPEGLEEGLRALSPPRWQVLVLHLLDPREMQPEINGPLELLDSETGQWMQLTLDSNVLAAYRHNVFTWQEQLAAHCARRGATYARILSDWPLEKRVVPYLRARRVLV